MTPHSQDGPVDETNTMGRVDARVRARLFGSEDSSVPRTLELRVGDRIGRHIVLEYLGAGGMGHVYAAHDPTLDRKVAIKLVSPRAWGDSQEARTRLLREAQALARLTHPNVVAVHDAGMECEQVWIAMELIDGQTLGDWVQERPRRWPEVLRILTDAAAGVTAAHAVGLVHRDLKPGNVMISRDGRVRVMDFGLAHATTSVDIGPTVPVNSSPLTTDVEATDGADSDPQTVFPRSGDG
jgi:serine/threonine protein kinase